MSNKIIVPEKVITRVDGTAMPKPADDQNTDDMVYGGTLNRITFKGYGKELFKNERENNPQHPLNDSRFAGANILIGGANYGCGSSREHAPQAHLDYGFKGLVTAGYAGIFQGNCAAIGLVAVTVHPGDIADLVKIIEEDPKTGFSIFLENRKIMYRSEEEAGEIPFEIPEDTRQAFLTGSWDAMDRLRANPEEVEAKMKEIPYFGFK